MTNDDGSTSSDNSSNNIQKIKIKKKRALVIGAGPSGIVTAKYLLQERPGEYDVTIVESSTTIGGTFVNKVYESSKLVSSKYITAFSDYRFDDLDNDDIDNDIEGEDDDDVSGSRTRRSSQTSKSGKSGGRVHPSTEEYVTYLQKYCRKYDVYDKIKFRCTVTSIQDNDNAEKDEVDHDENDENNVDLDTNGYIVKYEEETTTKATTTTTAEEVVIVVHEEHFDIVAVCSGLHNVPYIPQSIVDLKEKTTKQKKQHDNDDDKYDSCYDSTFYYDGDILHSSEYKSASIFTNKRVLIVGSGETAMDIAYHAISNTECKSVAMNVRRGFLSIPHTLRQGRKKDGDHGHSDDSEEQPLDVFITNLFEHSYEHPYVHKLRLRWILSTYIIRTFLWLTGSSVGFNQWCCETTPIKRGYHIINKSHLAMNHLNVPIKKQSIMGQFWLWIYNESKLRPIQSYHKTCIIGLVKDDEEEDGQQQLSVAASSTSTSTTSGTRSSRTILFDDGRTYQADIIILATGYKQSFPFLHESILRHGRKQSQNEQVNKNKSSSTSNSSSSTSSQGNNTNNTNNFVVDEDPLPSQHFITYPNRPRLGFIGFVRPNVGASKLQSSCICI